MQLITVGAWVGYILPETAWEVLIVGSQKSISWAYKNGGLNLFQVSGPRNKSSPCASHNWSQLTGDSNGVNILFAKRMCLLTKNEYSFLWDQVQGLGDGQEFRTLEYVFLNRSYQGQ